MYILQKLGIPEISQTPKGRPSFTTDVLDKLIGSRLHMHFCNNANSDASENAISAVKCLKEALSIATQKNTYLNPLQVHAMPVECETNELRIHMNLNLNTSTGRLSCRNPNLQNQPSYTDVFQIRKAFVAGNNNQMIEAGNKNILIVADYAQLELRVLAFLAECESMINAFNTGGDFHSKTALSMYSHIQKSIDEQECVLDENMQLSMDKKLPLVKELFKKERTFAKILNFSIAYGKTAHGLASDLNISEGEARDIVGKWYSDRNEVRIWQQIQMAHVMEHGYSQSIIGRKRYLFDVQTMFDFQMDVHSDFVKYIKEHMSKKQNTVLNMSHLWRNFGKKMNNIQSVKNINIGGQLNAFMRQAINSPVQSSAADIVMKAMLNINENIILKELGYKLLLQIHDELILEGPAVHMEEAKKIVKKCMETPWLGMNRILTFETSILCADNWLQAK